MENPDHWHAWLLVLLWAVHCFIVSVNLLWFVAVLVALPFNEYSWLWVSFFYCTSYICCAVLDLYEFRRYRHGTLYSSFFFCSQAIKCLLFTEGMCLELLERKLENYSDLSIWYYFRSEDATKLSTFYIGFAYSIYILHQQGRKSRRNDSNTHQDIIVSSSVGRIGVSPSPIQINSATDIVADAHTVLSLISWIEKDHVQRWKLPTAISTMLRVLIHYSKYSIGVFLIVIVMPFHPNLPGEPKKSKDEEEIWPFTWSYPRPLLGPKNASEPLQNLEPRSGARLYDQTSPSRSYSTFGPMSRASTGRLQNERVLPTSRLLSPRYLCILDKRNADDLKSEYAVSRVEDWLEDNNTRVPPDYVFISYTRQQFCTQRASGLNLSLFAQGQSESAVDEDRATLTKYAVAAARRANVSAFWIDFECVKPDEEASYINDMEDVYRICDIVRAAHSLAIIIGPPLGNSLQHLKHILHKDEWLLEWGKRMWTVPEALLCPSEHRIAIYDTESDVPELVAKRNLAGRVWDDADTIRQLIDHYEASLHLTQLELISLALECLQRRQTNTRNAGDVAYVLMGLLRLRPKVNKADSDFQAFARLSLANDSDKILERIMCLQGRGLDPAWHDMTDIWDSKLWFLDPMYHVVDIVDNNAVLVGDASGTSIDWKSLKLVDFRANNQTHRARWSLMRFSTSIALWISVLTAVFRPVFTEVQDDLSGISLEGLILLQRLLLVAVGTPLILALLMSIPIPAWLNQHFRSDFSSTQARMFGLQGRPDLSRVETFIFGASCGRFSWDPDMVETQVDGDNRPEFTIVDTLSLTAYRFRARRPPTLAFVGARERGLLRVILCSYDQSTETFVKEAVLRMPGSTLHRLLRLDDFQFATASTKD